MKEAPAKGQKHESETRVSLGNQPEFASLITFLIAEIRETLNTRIDLLNEKILAQASEIESLRSENSQLKQSVTEHEKNAEKIALPLTTSQVPRVQQAQQSINEQSTKQRGIKAHNLIFTCNDVGEQDPQKVINNILLAKFGRTFAVNAVHTLPSRGQEQSEQNNRGSSCSENNDATTRPNNETKYLVTFNSVWDSKFIYRERIRALRNSQIYIGEDLFKEEAHLFYLARQLKKQKIIHNTWTDNGEVLIVETLGGSPKILNAKDPIIAQQRMMGQETNSGIPEQITQKAPPKIKLHEPSTEIQASTSDSMMNVRITRQKRQDALTNGTQ